MAAANAASRASGALGMGLVQTLVQTGGGGDASACLTASWNSPAPVCKSAIPGSNPGGASDVKRLPFRSLRQRPWLVAVGVFSCPHRGLCEQPCKLRADRNGTLHAAGSPLTYGSGNDGRIYFSI